MNKLSQGWMGGFPKIEGDEPLKNPRDELHFLWENLPPSIDQEIPTDNTNPWRGEVSRQGDTNPPRPPVLPAPSPTSHRPGRDPPPSKGYSGEFLNTSTKKIPFPSPFPVVSRFPWEHHPNPVSPFPQDSSETKLGFLSQEGKGDLPKGLRRVGHPPTSPSGRGGGRIFPLRVPGRQGRGG